MRHLYVQGKFTVKIWMDNVDFMDKMDVMDSVRTISSI